MASFPFDLIKASLSTIVQALDDGIFTSEQLVQEYINRIKRDNIQGLGLRAVLELAPEEGLLESGRTADQTRQSGRKSFLHGIPILIKDSIGTGPELCLRTTGGTPALSASRPRKNAPVVQSLLDAGIIILGKANMTILGDYYENGIPNGWSPLGGQVKSPFGVDLDTSGSSAGSAVALAAGMAAATLGAETMGSIMGPAHNAGLWAMKPTPGSVSNKGIIPINPQFDTIGPFGKTVEDVACLLDVLIPDRGFQSSISISGHTPSIGVSSKWIGAITLEEETLFKQAQDCLGSLVVASDLQVPLHRRAKVEGCGDIIMEVGLKSAWKTYLEGVDGPIRSLQFLVDWHAKHPSFHPDRPGQSLLVDALNPRTSELAQAESMMEQLRTSFDEFMNDQGLDAIMYPWAGSAPLLAALAGLPICAAPFRLKEDGGPFGVLFVGRAGAETTLLHVLAACEKAFPERPVPDL